MLKLAHQDIDMMLIKSAAVIREQNAEIARLRGQLAQFDRRAYAEKIASVAVQRGLMDEDDAETYAEHLASSNRDLTAIEDLVSHTTAGVPLGEISKVANDESYGEGSAEERFYHALLSSDLA